MERGIFNRRCVVRKAARNIQYIPRLHPDRRLAKAADAGGGPCDEHVTGGQLRNARDIGDELIDRENQVGDTALLHDLAIEAGLDLEPLAGRRHFIGGHEVRTEAAGVIEVLAHVPLRCLALEFADRAFVAA